MYALSLMVLGLLGAVPATQPATQPAYYISKYSTTYHQGECVLLPSDDRQLAKPEDLRTRQPCRLCVRAADGSGPTTRPAADRLVRYYHLLRNEFVRLDDGSIELIGPELQQAILNVRAAVEAEKARVDEEAEELTRQIAAAERQRKESVRQERASRSEARRHESSAESYRKSFTRQGDSGQSNESLEDYDARAARQQAKSHRADADRAKDEVDALRADLFTLKKSADALAAMASPLSRTLPPREFWKDLPREQQDQLDRVGITLTELKALLARLGLSEASFVDTARVLEADTHSAEELAHCLRDYLDQKLGPRQPRGPATASAPAATRVKAAATPTTRPEP